MDVLPEAHRWPLLLTWEAKDDGEEEVAYFPQCVGTTGYVRGKP